MHYNKRNDFFKSNIYSREIIPLLKVDNILLEFYFNLTAPFPPTKLSTLFTSISSQPLTNLKPKACQQ